MAETPRTEAFRSGYRYGWRDAVWASYEDNIRQEQNVECSTDAPIPTVSASPSTDAALNTY